MDAPETPTGPAAAAILAAAAGSLLFAVLAFVGDAWPAAARALDLWPPSGPLSGVSLAGVLGWLAIWFGLNRRWRTTAVRLGPVSIAAFAMLAGAILLTFPPFSDVLQGR